MGNYQFFDKNWEYNELPDWIEELIAHVPGPAHWPAQRGDAPFNAAFRVVIVGQFAGEIQLDCTF
jgi:hypothetical protein